MAWAGWSCLRQCQPGRTSWTLREPTCCTADAASFSGWAGLCSRPSSSRCPLSALLSQGSAQPAWQCVLHSVPRHARHSLCLEAPRRRLAEITCRLADLAQVPQVFGADVPDGNAVSASGLAVEPPRPGSDLSARLCNVVAQLRSQHASQPPCFVVTQGKPGHTVAAHACAAGRLRLPCIGATAELSDQDF